MGGHGAYVAMTRGRRANIAVGVGDVQATLAGAFAAKATVSALEAIEREHTLQDGFDI